MKNWHTLLVTGILVLISTTGYAQLHNYYPLEIGNERYYVEEDNPGMVAYMHIDEMIDGMYHFERQIYDNGSMIEDLGLKATTNAEGDVYFHAVDFGDGVWWPLDPPYLLIDAPLFVGKVWTVDTYNEILGQGSVICTVVSEGWVTAPAGTFYAFEVVIDETWANVGQVVENHWFGDGLGQAKFTHAGHDSPFVLTDAVVVGVESLTWSNVKALFR
jgi:hypothetical protein